MSQLFRPINHKSVSLSKEEKMFRKLVSLLIAMSFLLISTAVAFAAEAPKPGSAPVTQIPGDKILKPAFVCPSGWHLKPGAQYACVPNKPAPVKCPEVPGKVYKYYEALNCTSSPTIGGSTCSGCELGCADMTPPK